MATQGDKEPPVSELVKQLVDDGKAYAMAELEVVRARADREARRAVAKYRVPMLMLGLSLGFATSAVTVLVVMMAIAIAQHSGPLLAGVIGAAIAMAISGVLYFLARKGLEEKE